MEPPQYKIDNLSPEWLEDSGLALSNFVVSTHMQAVHACVQHTEQRGDGLKQFEAHIAEQHAAEWQAPVSGQDVNYCSCATPTWLKQAVADAGARYSDDIIDNIFAYGLVVLSQPSGVRSASGPLHIIPPYELERSGRRIVVANAICGLPRVAFVVDGDNQMDPTIFVVLGRSVQSSDVVMPVSRRGILRRRRKRPAHAGQGLASDVPGAPHRFDYGVIEYAQHTIMKSKLSGLLPSVDAEQTAHDLRLHLLHNPAPRVLITTTRAPGEKNDRAHNMTAYIDSSQDIAVSQLEKDISRRKKRIEQEKITQAADAMTRHENVKMIRLPENEVVGHELPPASVCASFQDAHSHLVSSLGVSALMLPTSSSPGSRSSHWDIFTINLGLRTESLLPDVNAAILDIVAFLVAFQTNAYQTAIDAKTREIRQYMSDNEVEISGECGGDEMRDQICLVMATWHIAHQICGDSIHEDLARWPLRHVLPEYIEVIAARQPSSAPPKDQ